MLSALLLSSGFREAQSLTVVDDSQILSNPSCSRMVANGRINICENDETESDFAKTKLFLEAIPSPSDTEVIVEILPVASEEARGDAWLQRSASNRYFECERNMAEDKKDCPFAYVIVDSNPNSLRAGALGPSNLGMGIAMSEKSDGECMLNFLKVQLTKVPEYLKRIGWSSSLHLAPFALQVALPELEALGGPCEPGADIMEPLIVALGLIALTSVSICSGALMFRKTGGWSDAPYAEIPGEFVLEDGLGVQVFTKPEKGAKKIGELNKGPVEFMVTEMVAGWLHILTPIDGWISLANNPSCPLSPIKRKSGSNNNNNNPFQKMGGMSFAPNAEIPGEFVLEDGLGIQVFTKPEKRAKRIGELSKGPVEFTVTEMVDGWLHITTPIDGWISSWPLSPVKRKGDSNMFEKMGGMPELPYVEIPEE